jgi:mRNA interferase MazF
MARILRGEVRWACLDPVLGREQAGRRLVLVLSQDVFNQRSGAVIAVALTSQPQRAGSPLTLELQSAALPTSTWARISQIRTLSVERIGSCLARVSPEELDQVVERLNVLRALPVVGQRRRVCQAPTDLRQGRCSLQPFGLGDRVRSRLRRPVQIPRDGVVLL